MSLPEITRTGFVLQRPRWDVAEIRDVLGTGFLHARIVDRRTGASDWYVTPDNEHWFTRVQWIPAPPALNQVLKAAFSVVSDSLESADAHPLGTSERPCPHCGFVTTRLNSDDCSDCPDNPARRKVS